MFSPFINMMFSVLMGSWAPRVIGGVVAIVRRDLCGTLAPELVSGL